MKFKIFISLTLLILLIACKKEIKTTYTFANDDNKAYLKVIHTVANALVTPSSTTTAAINVYLNGTKLNGTAITHGGVFPGLEFAAVSAGATDVIAKIPAGVTTPEISVLTKSINLEAGSIYSAFLTDTLPTADILLIKEDLSAVADSGKYFVRFVNLTPKSTGYDLYATTDVSTVFTNVTYKTASSFVQLNVGTGARSFAVRRTGVATNLITTSISPVAGRMYTIFSYGIDGGTGARIPRVTFYTTRFQTPL